MKKIVKDLSSTIIKTNELLGHEIVAYRCKNSKNIAILARLNQGGINPPMNNVPGVWFGFIPIGETQGTPRFVGKSFSESVCNAIEKRDVFVFNNTTELCEWILNLK